MRRQQKFLAAAVLILAPCLFALTGCEQKAAPTQTLGKVTGSPVQTPGEATGTPVQTDEVKGKIKSVDEDGAKIVVIVQADDLALKVKNNCKITLDGEKADLGGLKAGMKVTVTYQVQEAENLAQEIVAEKAEE